MGALLEEVEAKPVQVLEERPVAARRAVTAAIFCEWYAPCDLGLAYPRDRGIAWPQPHVRTRLAGCGDGRHYFDADRRCAQCPHRHSPDMPIFGAETSRAGASCGPESGERTAWQKVRYQ